MTLLSDKDIFGSSTLLSDDDVFKPAAKAKSLLSDDDIFGAPKGGSFLPEVGKGVAGGAVSTTGSMLKGAAGQNAAMLQSRIDGAKARLRIMDMIDRGEEPPVGSLSDVDELDTVNVYKDLSPEQRKEFRRSQERVLETAVQPDIEGSPLYKAGQKVQDFSQEQFAAAKDYEDSWTRSISEGLGSTVPFLASAAAPSVGVAAGSFASSGEALERAIAGGATREQIIEAVRLGGVPGLTEQVPIETLFERVPLPYIGKFGTAVGKILSQAAAEGGQEAVQQVAQNLIERYTYNPDQDVMEGVAEAAGIGAIIGGGLKTVERGVDAVAGEQPAVDLKVNEQPRAGAEAATEADVLFGAEPPSQPASELPVAPPLDEVSRGTIGERPAAQRKVDAPELERARDIDRPNSPRLTPEDRASPIPNDVIDDGKAIVEDVLGPKANAEAGRQPALELERAPDLSTPGPRILSDADIFSAAPTRAEPAVDGEWARFTPESGTLGIPRSEMPQIKSIHRGALVNFLDGKGIAHRNETVPAADLKPTQAEFSREKVEKAKGFEGSDRSILVSSDNHILDGHHQWLAAREKGGDVKIIRLDAPIADLLPLAHELPSSTLSIPTGKKKREAAPQDIVQFLAAKGGIKDYRGELGSLDLRKAFVPGIGRLVRETGMTLDMAREAAEEAGYIGQAGDYQTTTVADLLDAIDRNRRGERVYSRADAGRAEARQAVAPDNRQIAVQEEVEAILNDVGGVLRPGEMDEVLDLIAGGAWPEEALVEVMERNALAAEAEAAQNAAPQEESDVPFDTAAEDRARREPSPAGQGQAAEGQGRVAPSRDEPRGGDEARAAAGGKKEEAALKQLLVGSLGGSPAQRGVRDKRPDAAKIEDFGEKIAGARKDQVRALADSLTAEVDILNEPLSKVFPQPDYAKLAEAGVDPRALALIAVAREQIPSKPRKGYKVARWAEQVRALRSFANDLLAGKFDPEAVRHKMLLTRALSGLADTATVISALDPEMLPQAAKWRVESGSYSVFQGQRHNPPKTIYSLVDDKGRRVTAISGDTLDSITEPARAAIRNVLKKQEDTGPRRTKLSIYSDRADKTIFIGLKGQSGVIRLKTGFANIKDARSYMEEQADELQAKVDELRRGPQMRRDVNRPREGVDRREGDVSPEQFQETFGFRGVQFGNYVEGGRRQFDLNEAYDGLMDLADVLGVPPSAISLNGTLGLAFGARGSGRFHAHYEPNHIVINLTKTKGAGSLAHEWFHGVDHYFANQDAGQVSRGFMSERRRTEGATRQEVFDAWKRLEQSLTGGGYSKRMGELDAARSKPYWNTMVEKAARGFEKYVVDRLARDGATNDYLANIDENAGAYPTNEEMREAGISDAFDNLLATVETKQTEQGTAMFRRRSPESSGSFLIREPAGGGITTELVLTDAFVEQAEQLTKALRSALDRMGLKDVGVRVAESIRAIVNGESFAADGRYFKGLIDVALDSENADSTLDHEAIHAMQRMGLFGKDEWAILERKSRREWMDRYKIGDNYAGFPEWVQVEEGIAHAYADWARGARVDGVIAKAFKKIKALLKAFAEALGAAGFRNAEDIFTDIAEGRVGTRPRSDAAGDASFSIPSETVETVDGPREQLVIPGAEKVSDKTLAERTMEGKKKPKAPQKDTSGLPLFGDDKDQMSLFQMAWHDMARTKSDETTNAVTRVRRAAAGAIGTRIMDAIKRGKNDGESVGDYSHRKMIDYLHPLRTLIEGQGGTVQDSMNAYLQARLADDAVVSRIQDMHGEFVTPMIEALAKSGASLEDLHRYLYARHAPERNRVVGLRNEEGSDLRKAVTDHSIKGASGWSTDEAKKVIAELRADPKKFAGIQEAARLVRQMLDANLLDQKQAGLISNETYDLLTKQWQHYVPLRSQDGVDDKGDLSPGRGFDVRGSEFKGATGRFSEAENIPAWAIALAERTHMRTEHNNVGKAVLRFLAKHDPKGDKLAKVYWSGEGAGFGGIEKAPTVHSRVINSEGKAVDKVVPPSTLSPTMFAVKDGGRTYYIQFADEKVGAALKNMGVMHLDALSRLARKWTGFQSLINTRANPAFVPINIIRDAATGGLHLLDEGFTAKEAAKILGSIPKAWGALWRNARGRPGSGEYDKALKEYISAGGKIAFEPHKTLEDTISELRKQMKAALGSQNTPKAKLKAMWQTFVKFVGDLNDAGENGMRLAAYMAAREKGKTVKQAAFLGRDLTVDFKKHGEIGPLMNAWFVFFNASIQGNYNIASRLLKSKKVRRAAYMIAASGVLLDIWNRAMSGDDDDEESYYSKMLKNEPWKFERQMVIFYGSDEGDYFTIPLPYGYNAIYNMGVQASAAAYGDVDPVEAVATSTRAVWDAFNPIGSGGHWLNMFMPSVLDPAIEIATNQSFTGAPITPTKFPGDVSPDSQSHFQSTPDSFRKAAEFFNQATGGNEVEPGLVDVSPDTLEHLWGYVSGGIGRFFGQAIDAGGKIATGRTDELEWEQIPIVRSFRGKFDDDGRKAEYYRLREEVQTAKSRYIDYLESGADEEAADFKARYPVEVEAIGVFDRAEKQLRKARKAKRAIDLDDDLSRAEKDEKLKPIEAIELEIMNSARLAYSKLRRAE